MNILKIIAFLALASTSFYSCTQHSQKPNILILYADDMGYGDVAAQNPDGKIPTPNIDQLISDGLTFTDGHSSSGVCTPSRYAMLTGRHHWRDFHKIVGAMGGPVFKDQQYTMASMFQENGYTTACIGKWHLGWNWNDIRHKDYTEKDSVLQWGRMAYAYKAQAYDWSKTITGGPLDRGFDYYFGDGTINFPPYAWVENDRMVEAPTVTMTTPKEAPPEGTWETRIGPAVKGWNLYDVLPTVTQKAVDYVKKQKNNEKPFFLYMAFPSPHAPIIPNQEFRGKSEAGAYGDFVNQTDWCMGQILKALEESGQTENTIVVFSADNGAEKYAYDRIQNFGHYSSGSFRGLKRDLYEGGHHVPFVVRWPKKIKGGSQCKQVISQVDLLKTFSELIGATLPAGLKHDSHDFSEVFLGHTSRAPIRKQTVQNTKKNKYAIRIDDWLYIDYKTGYHTKAPEWIYDNQGYVNDIEQVHLFNLKDDIEQKHNLASRYPEKVKMMKEELEKTRSEFTFTEE